MDANEKASSKFPRSSLRACNKTMIVSSSEAQRMREEHSSATAMTGSVATDMASSGVRVASEARSEVESKPVITGEALAHSGDTELVELVSEDSLDDLFSGLDEPDTANDVLDEPMPKTVAEEFNGIAKSEVPVSEQELPLPYEDPTENRAGEVQLEYSSGEQMHSGDKARKQTGTANQREYIEWLRPSKFVGFLVAFDGESFGNYVELREGRLAVSSEFNASENCLVISDASISPMHAIMRIGSDGSVLILDQLSEHGTRIRRGGDSKEESLMGDKSSLNHGDMVIFGECTYYVCIFKKK